MANSKRQQQRERRKNRAPIQIWVDKAVRQELKVLLATQEQTFQELLEEYLHRVLHCARRNTGRA